MQLSGLVSGIDTESLIDQLMLLERQPVTLLTQKKTGYQSEVNAWSSIKTSLVSLNGKLDSLELLSTFQAKKVTTDDETVASASAAADALTGTYHLHVISLADSTKVSSSTRIGSGLDAGSVLKDAGLGTAVSAGTFSINGVSFSVDPETETLNDIIAKINDPLAGVPGVTASYDSASDKFTLTGSSNIQLGSGSDTSNFFAAMWVSGKTGSTITSSVPLGTVQQEKVLDSARFQTPLSSVTEGCFKINGVEITYNTSLDSLNDIVARINNSDTGVTASYDSLSDSLCFSARDTGSIAIALEDVNGNFLEAAGVLGAVQDLGDNAVYSIDEVNGGQPLTSTQNTISEAVPGIVFTLKKAGEAEIGVSIDPDTAVDNIKEFVTQYNNVMNLIKGKLAKEAVLQGDPSLIRMQSAIRMDTTGVVTAGTGGIVLASQAGLQVDKEGVMTFDEAKFKDLLESKPDAVFDLFNGTDGIAVRLKEELELWTKSSTGIIPTKEESINKQIENVDDHIERLEARLEMKRAVLVKKFTEMETVMSTLLNQGDWLSAQVQSLPGMVSQNQST